MASEFPLRGEDIKRLLKKSRVMPIAFAFNPGTMDEDDEYFAAHAKKKPEMLGKLAHAEGAGSKSAFGTFTAIGSEISLTCFRTIPQLAKRLKKFLKANKIALNVVVMDPDGNVIDTDVETLSEWFDEGGDADAETEAEAPEAEAEETAPETAADPAAEAAELGERLKALGPEVRKAPPDVAARVQAGFAGAVALLKAGKLDEAEAALSKLELVTARLAHLAANPPAAAAPQADPPPKAPPVAPPPPPETAARDSRLTAVLDRLEADIDRAGPGAAALAARLEDARARARAGETEAALGLVRQIPAALAALAAAQAKWERASTIIAPLIETALRSGRVADPAGLRSRWAFATGTADEGQPVRALAALPGIVAMLRDQAPAAAAEGEGVVAFQRARVLWGGTRAKMMDEAEKLAATITAQSADDEDAAEVARAAREIVAQVGRIDARLEDLLDRITNADPPARPALRAQAAQVAAAYQAELGQGLFAVLDANPFAAVSVTGRARAALAAVAQTLA